MRTSNKKHREYEEQVRGVGCYVTGATNPLALDVHHLRGRTFKHNKEHIGWALCVALHQPNKAGYHKDNLHMNGDYSIHTYKEGKFSERHKPISNIMYSNLDVIVSENRWINSDGGDHSAPWTYRQWLAILDYLL